jgi:hypothetical protein
MAACTGLLLLVFLAVIPGMVSADTHVPGETVDVALTIVNPATGAAISGEAPTAAIYRCSDGYYWDWASSTFKASAWTTQYSPLTEIGTTGRYISEVDTDAWSD